MELRINRVRINRARPVLNNQPYNAFCLNILCVTGSSTDSIVFVTEFKRHQTLTVSCDGYWSECLEDG